MSTVELRPALIDDLPEMHTLYRETIDSTCRDDYDPGQRAVWKAGVQNKTRWEEAITSQYFLVACLDRKIVGFGSLKDGNYLDFMYVHKDHQRQGIADRLFQALEAEANRLGSPQIDSDVSKTARPFFERKGFRVMRENRKIIQGVEIVNYKMVWERSLS